MIGARSSVFKDMPPGQVCLGTPCQPRYPRKIKDIGVKNYTNPKSFWR